MASRGESSVTRLAVDADFAGEPRRARSRTASTSSAVRPEPIAPASATTSPARTVERHASTQRAVRTRQVRARCSTVVRVAGGRSRWRALARAAHLATDHHAA